MSQISSVIERFDSISLNQMDEVALLNRFDVKYQLTEDELVQVLNAIKNDYYILEINNSRIHNYNTIYYDTRENDLYINHHNGKLNRIKIRKRIYADSDLAFLEIKKKNNRSKTKKLRMIAENNGTSFTGKELEFLAVNTNFDFHISKLTLPVKNTNSFKRITLVNKDFSERCTIDLQLVSCSRHKKVVMKKMAIIELKQSSVNEKTALAQQLLRSEIKQSGFSKYCMGRALLEPRLKQNLFKERMLRLKKQFNGKIAISPIDI
ncbi:polyphosphate polymerase domain-containing protein [Draconibacterium sp. IB214405]|uniref:polyphosphate polymerase domain-containing protein n=1 Tax=Draconibacterium sp. IB214405 TaxID=3097352 RepID=UPI002A170A97|nr:polyphosphate polymerase domain-containing protein [Draconibacterium sp. IB214405]MDX8338971.1 polyphosphate polymerase domain-containing protein [Draconibacterium sp. IB214405]